MCSSDLVGVILRQVDLGQQLVDFFLLFLFAVMHMNAHALGDDFGDGHAGVQGGIRVLENHLSVFLKGKQLLAPQMRNFLSFEKDLPGGLVIELEQRAAAGGFAAAGFAH